MTGIFALLGAKGMAVLGGIATAVAGALGIFLAGKRTARTEARAERAEASLATRNRIDEASTHAPTDPDAARAALRDRLSRRKP